MTQTAHVPARGPASNVPPKPARLGPEQRPETLPASTTPLYGAIDDGLIPCLTIRESRSRIALDTTIILCAEHAVARHREPDFPAGAWPLPQTPRARAPFTSRAPALGCADVCGFGMVPADPGRTPRYDRSTQNIGNRLHCQPRAKASHSAYRAFSASPAPGGFSPEAKPGRVSSPASDWGAGCQPCSGRIVRHSLLKTRSVRAPGATPSAASCCWVTACQLVPNSVPKNPGDGISRQQIARGRTPSEWSNGVTGVSRMAGADGLAAACDFPVYQIHATAGATSETGDKDPCEAPCHRVARIIRPVGRFRRLGTRAAAERAIEPDRSTGYTSLPLPCEPGQQSGRPTEAVISGPGK